MTTIDPGVEIPVLQEKPKVPIATGKTSIPYYISNDFYPKVKRDDQKEYQLYPLIPVETTPATIVNASIIPVLHNIPNFDPAVNFWYLQPFALCINAQFGYTPGETVSVSDGVSVQCTATTADIIVRNNGAKIIRKDSTLAQANLNVNNWQIFAKGFFFVPSLEV